MAESADLRHLERHVLRLDAAFLVVHHGGARQVDAAPEQQRERDGPCAANNYGPDAEFGA
jgi:hypothetical protein